MESGEVVVMMVVVEGAVAITREAGAEGAVANDDFGVRD